MEGSEDKNISCFLLVPQSQKEAYSCLKTMETVTSWGGTKLVGEPAAFRKQLFPVYSISLVGRG